jgi:site-specific recombinase XerD
MARVNIVKQIKVGDRWVLKAIPRKENGERDWKALPEGSYFVEWRTNGKRKREPAGLTVSEALEARRIKKAELAATAVGILQRYKPVAPAGPEPLFLSTLIRRYLDQIDTLKKPNTYRKYNAVLTRFEEQFPNRRLEQISIEELNDFVVKLRKSGLSANTVLHNVVIVAQFFKRNGRSNITRELQLPEAILCLPKVYSEEQQSRFLTACDPWELALFSKFLLTGFREQEVMYLFWRDLNLKLRTVRVVSKPDLGFSLKRWEEREVPVPVDLAQLLANHSQSIDSPFVFPSPTGNREQNFLRRCKEIATRAGLDASTFDLKTFRSTYGTSMLRSGFDVRTVQHWMGHKSLETTMRYLAPAQDVHDRLDRITIPGKRGRPSEKIKPQRAGRESRSTRNASRAS